MHDKEEITIGEAVGFWRKNKSWIMPAIMAILGMLGGANVDKVGAILPSNPETITLSKRVDSLELRVTALDGKTAVLPTPDESKKNGDGSPKTNNDDGVIHIGQ